VNIPPTTDKRPLELGVVFPRRTSIRLLVLTALLFGTFLLAVPSAGAANCGKALINEYFFTGRLAYHTQECYGSALKQLDPDARMYSGIMGAIRAARSRDKAADAKAAAPVVVPDTTDTTPPPVDTLPLPDPLPPTATGTDVPESRAGAIVPIETTQAAMPIETTQAAMPTVTTPSQVPLTVILLGGLAVVLTLVGLGGLTVRWLDRGA
jgi:hypothetical protein